MKHMIPPLGAENQDFQIRGGPLTEADYRKAVEEIGLGEKTIVGSDLLLGVHPRDRHCSNGRFVSCVCFGSKADICSVK
jgi:hypothetical protein